MTLTAIAFTILGWVVGYLTSLFASEHLEMRRARRSVVSLCDSVISRISDDLDIGATYRESIPALEPAFIAALGFLKGEKRKQASDAWASYRSFDPALFPEADFLSRGRPDPRTGGDTVTRPDAISIELRKIRSCFEG